MVSLEYGLCFPKIVDHLLHGKILNRLEIISEGKIRKILCNKY
jgi:hypothetical protein